MFMFIFTKEQRDERHNWQSKNEHQVISYSVEVFL